MRIGSATTSNRPVLEEIRDSLRLELIEENRELLRVMLSTHNGMVRAGVIESAIIEDLSVGEE